MEDMEYLLKRFFSNTEKAEELEKRCNEAGINFLTSDFEDFTVKAKVTEIMLSMISEEKGGPSTKDIEKDNIVIYINCRCRLCNKNITLAWTIKSLSEQEFEKEFISKGYIHNFMKLDAKDDTIITKVHDCSEAVGDEVPFLDIISVSDFCPNNRAEEVKVIDITY